MKSIFEKIIDGELPADKVFESDRILAIKDKFPVAPVHLLIIPKKHFKNLQSVDEEDADLIGEVVHVAQMLAVEFNVQDNYRFITNVGSSAGQSIFYLHFHLIGGRKLKGMG